MAGRAIEGICRHHQTKGQYLGHGSQELKERGIIDGRLFEWSQELHWHRNEAAHAGNEEIELDDARDLFEFALAICEYVFTLSDRFRRFKDRRDAARTRRAK